MHSWSNKSILSIKLMIYMIMWVSLVLFFSPGSKQFLTGSAQDCYRTHHWIPIQAKLMNILIKGANQVICGNKSIVLSTSVPSSTLKQKHNAITYHWVREAVAATIVKVSHIAGRENVADSFVWRNINNMPHVQMHA